MRMAAIVWQNKNYTLLKSDIIKKVFSIKVIQKINFSYMYH